MITPEEWVPSGGLNLEQSAHDAIQEIVKHSVVIAGPGAGKTELLAQRADFLMRTGVSPYSKRILAISFKVDAARNLQERVRLRSGPQHAARFQSFTFNAFAKRLIDNYRPALTGENALYPNYRLHPTVSIKHEQITFKQQVPLATKIVRSNSYALNSIRQTYSHVFLDEFQDATEDQYAFLFEAFFGQNVRITAVGDPKQRIMGFAGALDGVMSKFASEFDANIFQLSSNFRAQPRLRAMVNSMACDIENIEQSAADSDPNYEGNDGVVEVKSFNDDSEEAAEMADRISKWIDEGVPASEIAVIIRNQPHLVASKLFKQLSDRGIPFRNESDLQDLSSEPGPALILDFLRVIAVDRQPEAYCRLLRSVSNGGSGESDSLVESRLQSYLAKTMQKVRSAGFDRGNATSWFELIEEFSGSLTESKLRSLSPAYEQGQYLEELRTKVRDAFERELAVDGEPINALNRLSEVEAVRIMTIHKSKGLEFKKVIVMGVEEQLYWGKDLGEVKSEFFVAISRAKDELVLTHVNFRPTPADASSNWAERRTAHGDLLVYARK